MPDAAAAERAARARLATLARQAQTLSDNLALATTPAQIAAMLEQIERLDAQKRAAAQELDDIATAAERARAQQAALAQAQQTCRRIAEGLESTTPAQQEALLHLVIDRVTVYQDRAHPVRPAHGRGGGCNCAKYRLRYLLILTNRASSIVAHRPWPQAKLCQFSRVAGQPGGHLRQDVRPRRLLLQFARAPSVA